ncbi:hypothetical protein AJ88_03015 [Mesorhizobium amorphae CCBAU 01583]|nr:hypothetical protein AJ88_03015 [Mesorhizobium amorphae CCBAU 01583]
MGSLPYRVPRAPGSDKKTMTRMTTAELRGYQQICGRDGAMMAIACDQRGGMRTLLASDPEEQAKITNDMLGDTKADITRYLASEASCVLLDPLCAVPRVVDEGVLNRDTALSSASTPRASTSRSTATACRASFPASMRAACASSAAPAARSWCISGPTSRKPTSTTSPSSESASPISRRRTCCWSSSS